MESSDRHLIGQQLGTCVLKDVIGAGGMGMVYLAQQTRPTRQVAVKVLKSGVGMQSEEHQEFLARFRREANVIAQLDHINILPIYEYGEENGLAYLVMPYLAGGSLRTLLSEKVSLSPIEAFGYFEQAASALQYAHSHKIVHRDIKPANMLFHADGRLVLADFGIARIIGDGNESREDSITATGYFMGSVDYMAPEMAKGMKVDHRADIYELGIVLFQMLTGQIPFQGSTPFIVAAMHINNAPPSMRQLKPSLPAALDAVVMRALAKEADDRYRTVGEFAEAFRRALSSSYSLLPNMNYQPGVVSPFPGSATNALYTPQSSLSPEEQQYATVETDTPQPVDATQRQPPSVPLNPHQVSGSYMYAPQAYNDVDPRMPRQMQVPHIPVEAMYASQHLAADETSAGHEWNAQAVSPLPSYPYAAPPQSPTRRRHGWIWVSLLLCMLFVVLVSGGVIFWPRIRGHFISGGLPHTPVVSQTTIPPATSPTASPVMQAQAALSRYYNYINMQDYQPAYMMWSENSEYHSTHSYQQFVSGYADTAHVDVQDGPITVNNDGSYHIPVTLKASDTQGNISNYTGYYDLKLVDGSWQIVGALIK